MRSVTRKATKAFTALNFNGYATAAMLLEDDNHQNVRGMRDSYADELRQSGRTQCLSEGISVHYKIIQHHMDHETFIGNLLVEMYGKCGSVDHAAAAFANILNKNVYSWTMLLSAYAYNGHFTEALTLYKKMYLEGVRPDRVAFIHVIGACTGVGNAIECDNVHGNVCASGLESDFVIQAALVHMYAQTGRVDEARLGFDRMVSRNVVSWTIMIAAYNQTKQSREALSLYRQMNQEGVQADIIAFSNVLGSCCDAKSLSEGKEIHSSIVYHGFHLDGAIGSGLVNMYGQCGSLENAKRVFDSVHWQCAAVWNAMITAYSHAGYAHEALRIYLQMEQEGVMPEEVTFICILGVCSTIGLTALCHGRAAHRRIVSIGINSDVISNTLIKMYGECHSIENARLVFDGLASIRDPVSWNTMLAAYAENELANEAMELYHKMDQEGVEPNNVTFISVISACLLLGALEKGKALHQRIVASGNEDYIPLATSLLSFYGSCGSIEDAIDLFERLQWNSAVAWNAMITAYDQSGRCKEALELFRRMDMNGVGVSNVSLIIALGVCSNLADAVTGRKIHSRVIARGGDREVIVGTAIVSMYGKCGLMDEAMNVFEKLTMRNVVSWNSMISGYAQHGHGKVALRLFKDMLMEGIKPDESTMTNVLFVCSHLGLVEEGVSCFLKLNEDHGIIPIGEHYGCLVDLLGRAGWLKKAEDLMMGMPLEPDDVIWTSLLGACKVHGDIKLGSRLSNMNVSSTMEKAGPYVMLSNIFVS